MKKQHIDRFPTITFFRSLLLATFVLVVQFYAFAQIKFYASTNIKQVPVNQNFQINFTVENGQATQLKPPALNDFQVLSGPNTSTSMQWVNGTMTQSVTYSYILRPKKEGTFKIGRAVATISGTNVESNELSITVTAPAQEQPQSQRQPRFWDPFEDPFFQQDIFDPFNQQQQQQRDEPQANINADAQKTARDNLLVRLVIDRNNVYAGEKITATLKIYTRLNFANVSITKAPSFNGFWSQEVKLPKEQKPHQEKLNGQDFYVFDVMKYNLYPQKSGTLPITAAELNMVVQVPVQRRRRSIFDDFFGGGSVVNIPFKPSSNAAQVIVKELPENGKPENFSGAVGQFTYDVKLSAKEGKTDDALTYSMKLSGSGNLKTVELPQPNMPEGFEVFDPKLKEDISNGATGMTGTKQYDYLVIPRLPGEYKIAATSFSYFDPAAQKYVTLHSPEFTVKITGEPSQNLNSGGIASTHKQEVHEVGQDIRYIKMKSDRWQTTDITFFGSLPHFGLLGAPLLLFIGLVFVKRRNEDMAADVVGAKRRRATKLAKKRLATASKLATNENNKTAFYDEVSRALWGYVGDKLSIDPAQLSKENVAEKLTTKNAKPETITRLQNLLSTCELALYSPIGAGSEMKQNYESAVSLIADLEEELK